MVWPEANFCFNEKNISVTTSVVQRSFLDVNFSFITNKINTMFNVTELRHNDKEYLQLFSLLWHKPDKGHLKREGFILSHCWGHISQHGGKEGIVLGHEATDRVAVQSGSTGRSMEVLISFPAPFPPFMQSGHTIHA